jgi:hypothetical protein
MNISPQVRSCQNNYQVGKAPNFTALKKGNYGLLKGLVGENGIYQLGQNDIPLLENFITNIDKFYEKHQIKDEATQEIVLKAFQAGVDLLKRGEQEAKAKVLMAMHEGEPCGILVGDALKIDKQGRLNYSSRKNCAKKETELDFLAAWKPGLNVGKSLVTEYFARARNDGFKSIYVRSEVPQLTGAVEFYTKNGFRSLTGQRQQLDLKKGDRSYVVGDYFDAEDLILPMKATSKRIDEVIQANSKKLKREEVTEPIHQELLSAYIPTDKSIISKLTLSK